MSSVPTTCQSQERLLIEEKEKGRHQKKKYFSGMWVLELGQELKR